MFAAATVGAWSSPVTVQEALHSPLVRVTSTSASNRDYSVEMMASAVSQRDVGGAL